MQRPPAMQRRRIEVRGIVQGVGFRPHVCLLARRLGLTGYVRNRPDGVVIEVEGAGESLDRFLRQLRRRPPPLARIESLRWRRRPLHGDRSFLIRASRTAGQGQPAISPDVAVCRQCLAEMYDPSDRRYRYPFINCTNCGPRLTIVNGAPYDRARTTMAGFALCRACAREYADVHSRRFHAQPIACPDCGPRLALFDASGRELSCRDPLQVVGQAIRAGKIVAIKGLGGYHLACDAGDSHAVGELRRRKNRDAKPLAVMVKDLAAAARHVQLDEAARRLLASPQAPIVVLNKRSSTSGVCEQVAPGNPTLGLMLAYTPLHHLLLDAVGASPLVMTSGNRGDEPICYRDDEAVQQLGGIADLFLTHDRPIQLRCDDSLVRHSPLGPMPLRRSRGYAPAPIRLPWPLPAPILAVGGQLKSVFALGAGSQAILSHHLGDLDHLQAFQAFQRDIAQWQELFAISPRAVAHDLHPDYASTRYALDAGLPCLAIGHHHAHMASCMAEHGLDEKVIGVIFDGAGLGDDGAVWGGEFLVGDYRGYQRVAHLRYLPLPGGEMAIRQGWRMALAHLVDAGRRGSFPSSLAPPAAVRTVEAMLDRSLASARTSSMGRLFDAVAALVGAGAQSDFEGQSAMRLEWLATGRPQSGVYDWEAVPAPAVDAALPSDVAGKWVVDSRPLIRGVASDLAAGAAPETVARRFHSTVVEMVVSICQQIRTLHGLSRVVLSGGVFQNGLLSGELAVRLRECGFDPLAHRLAPANDGGLCLGQLAVAAQRLAGDESI